MKNNVNTLVRYVGGKGRMCNKLKSIAPKSCDIIAEPFMGSAVLSINSQRFKKYLVNDKDYYMANLLQVVADKATGNELLAVLKSMLVTKDAFQQALKRRKKHAAQLISPVELAAETWFLLNCSFNGRGTEYSAPQNVITWKENKINETEKIVRNISNRDFRVFCSDAIEFMCQEKLLNNPSAFIYLDPPYIEGVRSNASLYRVDMPSQFRHMDLLVAIRSAKAKCVISGYDSEIYDEKLLGYDWYKYSLGEYPKGCDTSAEKSKGTEIIWTNYDIAKEAPKALEHITECK